MEFTIPTSMVLQILSCFSILFSVIPEISAQFSFLNTQCSQINYKPNSTYQSNLNQVLNSLSSNTQINYGFYNFSAGHKPNRVEAIALCRGDVSLSNCRDCVRNSASGLQSACPAQTGAFGYSENCLLFYYNISIFHQVLLQPAYYLRNDLNEFSSVPRMNNTLFSLLEDLQNRAAVGSSELKYAAGNVSVGVNRTLYGMVQCNPDLTRSQCVDCVQGIKSGQFINLTSSPPTFMAAGARAVSASCNLRYELWDFYGPVPVLTTGIVSQCTVNRWSNGTDTVLNCMVTGTPPSVATDSMGPAPSMVRPPPLKGHATKKYAPPLIAIFTFIPILLIAIGIWVYIYKRKIVIENSNLDADDIRTTEFLQFDLSTIKAATRNFSTDNKLGEGGFGQVYKGVLEDGQEIAAKRLSKSSGQGIVEFKTEVLLVAKLQHKNLVKLLGFCLASNEKILVYEYLRNSSLDQHLFDPTKKIFLDWRIRFKVIAEIARGLLYLHEDSRLKIIHRDLKTSNILLNEDMSPKISDFGLAKLFGLDETQGDTKRIVGTYGYMAPEYAMLGHFSVKSDVYSYGIIVLEILSGQKNRFFGRPQLEEALLHRAWRLWNERNALILVDATLDNNYPIEEVTKCIHIGLLCIQENATDRPKMATVVAALNGRSVSLPMPKAPNFFEDCSASTDIASAQYKISMRGSEIEYRQVNDIYSGTNNITDLYPR